MQMSDIRAKVSSLYSGLAWKDRVRRMPDRQVFAIYNTAKKNGKFDHKKKIKSDEERAIEKRECYQYTLFDYI